MGTILGMEYSSVRRNDDDEREYYIDDWNDWYTRDDIREELKIMNSCIRTYGNSRYGEQDGCDWED